MKEADLYSFDSKRLKAAGGIIAGVDEAGRGPLAGPVTAAAVALDYTKRGFIGGLNDSKKLSARQRARIFALVKKKSAAFAVASVSSAQVDSIGILPATFKACRRAVRGLEKKLGRRRKISVVIFDGNLAIPRLNIAQKTLVGGDGKSACVAAASVAAKVRRDSIMRRLELKYPGYGFARHKGYGTAAHIAVLKRRGACPEHRKSFVKKFV